MKKLFFIVLVISFFQCTKSGNSESIAINGACPLSAKAVVKKMILNESGSDYFYYLALDTNIDGSDSVFPSTLDQSLQIEGTKVNIRFSATNSKYGFVPCLAGHTMDPNNPDTHYMPKVDVCSAKTTL